MHFKFLIGRNAENRQRLARGGLLNALNPFSSVLMPEQALDNLQYFDSFRS